MVAILKMSVKLATLGIRKVKVFSNKGYHVVMLVHGITYYRCGNVNKVW